MLTWVLISAVVALSHCWVLEVNEKHVAKKLTNNVTFHCHYDGDDNEETTIAQVSRIRLLKFQSGNKWKTVAKLTDFRQKVSTEFSFQPEAYGHAGNLTNSFMTIHFSVATNDVIGQFVCEIDGYDVDDELTAVKTDPVIISERGVSYDDLLDIILNLKKEEEGAQVTEDLRMGLLEKAIRVVENTGKSRDTAISSLANRLNSMSNAFLKTTDNIAKAQKKILKDLDTIKQVTSSQTQAWPEGVYTLLNTTSGCPGSFSFFWTESYLRITTQAGRSNTDNTSNGIHLSGPVLESSGNNNYVHMRFCTKKVASAGPAWPRGSYCVNNYQGTCPTNLVSGKITFDRENIGSYDTHTDLTSVSTTNDITTVSYCCRNDGDPEHPVLLPAQNPFYLYRFGGQCQEVIGMNVSDEWLFLDTKEIKDAFIGTSHPDATLRNIKLQLCYYTPKV